MLGTGVAEMGSSPTAFGHLGHGGSSGFADPRYRLAVSVARNRFSEQSTASLIVEEIQRTLGIA
jgi:CubicO group peptidase (beta-lactamase class C family)